MAQQTNWVLHHMSTTSGMVISQEITNVVSWFRHATKNTLIEGVAGTGKSAVVRGLVAAMVAASRLDKRSHKVLIVCPVNEILDDTAAKYAAAGLTVTRVHQRNTEEAVLFHDARQEGNIARGEAPTTTIDFDSAKRSLDGHPAALQALHILQDYMESPYGVDDKRYKMHGHSVASVAARTLGLVASDDHESGALDDILNKLLVIQEGGMVDEEAQASFSDETSDLWVASLLKNDIILATPNMLGEDVMVRALRNRVELVICEESGRFSEGDLAQVLAYYCRPH